MRVFLYKEGLARFATEPYSSPLNVNLTNLYMHLTNYAINKSSQNYVQNNDKEEIFGDLTSSSDSAESETETTQQTQSTFLAKDPSEEKHNFITKLKGLKNKRRFKRKRKKPKTDKADEKVDEKKETLENVEEVEKNANQTNCAHKRSLNFVWKTIDADLKNNSDESLKKINSKTIRKDIEYAIVKTLITGQPSLAHTYKSCQPEDCDNSSCFEILGN
jgi:hypothetical protein